MKMFTKFVHFLFVYIIAFSAYAQTISFDLDYDGGKINKILIVEKDYVFSITKDGHIDCVIKFSSENEALKYIQNPQLYLLPQKKLSLNGMPFYINTYKTVEYCKNYSSYSRAGIVGEICALDNLKISNSVLNAKKESKF